MVLTRLAAAALAGCLLTGCASSVHWRNAAVGVSALDVATTTRLLHAGGREMNPVYGASPSQERLALVNAALLGFAWYVSRDWPERNRARMWRWMTLLRALPVAWNSYQLAGADAL